MALTADDVLNQKFTITKFRDGYDLDQVDDFLDGVVEEFRTFEDEKNGLINQINELTEKLNESTASLEQANSALKESESRLEQCQTELAEAKEAAATPPAAPQEAPILSPAPTLVAPAAPAAPAVPVEQPATDDAVKSSAMLQLALELHDKYIREGEARKAELIASGEQAVKDLMEDGNKQRAVEIATLNEQKNALQEKVDELRSFESEYRTTLKSYIEAQLRNLEGEISGSINS